MPDSSGYSIHDAADDDQRDDAKRPQRERIIESALNAGITFWRDGDGNAYATVPGADGELARYRVRSPAFRLLLRLLYGRAYPTNTATRTIPGSMSDNALAEAVAALEAIGLAGPIREPDVRVLRYQNAVWIDLGDSDWKLVRVAPEGWRLVKSADVPLVRPNGLRSLPTPVSTPDRTAALAELRRLLNVPVRDSDGREDDTDFRLIVAWLVAALYPVGPYPILTMDGEQGSGKSTACRLLRRLVDPNKADLRAPPRKEDDLIVAAQSGRIVAWENVSSIDGDMADALCRLATGGGLGKRQLYTDGDEYIISVARPILLNGIPNLLARGDLADRAIAVTLPAIPDDKRRTEAEVMADFERAAPAILGVLLDGLATALRQMPSTKLSRLPRMADFALLACAAAPAFGWKAEEMLTAMEGNRERAVAAVIDADPMAEALQDIAAENRPYGWSGTATLLLDAVNREVAPEVKNERGWPKDAARLTTRLKRLAPALRRAGVDVQQVRTGAARRVTVMQTSPSSGSASPPSPASPKVPEWGCSSDASDASDADPSIVEGEL